MPPSTSATGMKPQILRGTFGYVFEIFASSCDDKNLSGQRSGIKLERKDPPHSREIQVSRQFFGSRSWMMYPPFLSSHPSWYILDVVSHNSVRKGAVKILFIDPPYLRFLMIPAPKASDNPDNGFPTLHDPEVHTPWSSRRGP